MKLEETSYDNSETGCCARLEPKAWDGREFDWSDKLFLKDHVRSFVYVPLNMGTVMTRAHEKIQSAQAYPAEPLWLYDESFHSRLAAAPPLGKKVAPRRSSAATSAYASHFIGVPSCFRLTAGRYARALAAALFLLKGGPWRA